MGPAPCGGADAQQVATARSFGFEWGRFPEMRGEWERNFLEYQAPHPPDFFQGKRVLDAGCGSGRHAYYAARYGAEVWAIDLGPAVEVARRNTDEVGTVRIVQANIYNPPFAPESFDYIYSLGVLHHLPDPEAGFRSLLRYLKPGGEIQIFLYWKPEGQPIKRGLLAVTSAVRRLTTRLPHEAVYALSYAAAWLAVGLFVWPYRVLKRVPSLRQLAERLPMKQYAYYPFRVCVNDQFDRLSAPIENRYTRGEVEAWLRRAGLELISIGPNFGWMATGRKSDATSR
jgi:SAM-dependent methyltransferase